MTALFVSSVRKLRPPFFKVEDVSRQYRPIIYETTQWPVPNLSCSPFDAPRDGEPTTLIHTYNLI